MTQRNPDRYTAEDWKHAGPTVGAIIANRGPWPKLGAMGEAAGRSRSGMIPILGMGTMPVLGVAVRLVGSREVLQLTGLTGDQLREWTVRRALIHPDVPALKRGSEAKFTWQTVLLLRLAVVLRTRFHVELQAHRDLLTSARALFDGASFPALWGTTLAIYDLRRCELVQNRKVLVPEEDAVLLRLDRHLEVLSEGFGLLDPVSQLPLFPAVPIRSTDETVVGVRLVNGAR